MSKKDRQKEKGQKRAAKNTGKLKYSLWNNVKFILNKMWQWDRKGVVLTFLRAPFLAGVPLMGIYLSRTVVSLVGGKADLNGVVLTVILICTGIAVSMVILNR